MARFITGDLSVSGGWDGYIADLNRMGIQEYMSIYQAAYDVWNSNK
jgi:hypothetical protein